MHPSSDRELPAHRDCGKHHSLNHTVEPKSGSFQVAEIHAGTLAASYLSGALGQEGRPPQGAGHAPLVVWPGVIAARVSPHLTHPATPGSRLPRLTDELPLCHPLHCREYRLRPQGPYGTPVCPPEVPRAEERTAQRGGAHGKAATGWETPGSDPVPW